MKASEFRKYINQNTRRGEDGGGETRDDLMLQFAVEFQLGDLDCLRCGLKSISQSRGGTTFRNTSKISNRIIPTKRNAY